MRLDAVRDQDQVELQLPLDPSNVSTTTQQENAVVHTNNAKHKQSGRARKVVIELGDDDAPTLNAKNCILIMSCCN